MSSSEFGLPALKKLVESQNKISAVYTQPPKKSGRGLKMNKSVIHQFALQNNLCVRTPTNLKVVELRSKLWDSIRSLNKKGVTIILTTHYLKEAEILCDRIAVINKGKVIACDKKKRFMQLLDEKELIIEFSEQIKKIPNEIKKYCKKKSYKSLTLKFKKSKISTADIIKIFVEKKFKLKEISTKESDLEDIFIKLLKD